MGTDSANARERETAKLLNYGYRYFEGMNLYDAGKIRSRRSSWSIEVDSLAIGPVESIYRVLPKGARDRLELTLEMDQEVIAPVSQGQVLGQVQLSLDGEVLSTTPVVALGNVAEGGLFKKVMDWVLRAMQ